MTAAQLLFACSHSEEMPLGAKRIRSLNEALSKKNLPDEKRVEIIRETLIQEVLEAVHQSFSFLPAKIDAVIKKELATYSLLELAEEVEKLLEKRKCFAKL